MTSFQPNAISRGALLSHDFNLPRDCLVRNSRYTDIYVVPSEHHGRMSPVARKLFRFKSNSPSSMTETFQRVGILGSSRHEQLSPVYDLQVSANGYTTMSGPWYTNGNIKEYLENHSEADKLKLVLQLASGLEYLHTHGVAHGGIKPNNVLIDDDGNVRLTDARVDVYVRDCIAQQTGFVEVPASSTYMCAEDLLPSTPDTIAIPSSMAGDVYSFACTTYKIFTGRPPTRARLQAAHIFHIVYDTAPLEKPVEIDEALWNVIEPCLKHDSSQRPSMVVVHAQLRAISETVVN